MKLKKENSGYQRTERARAPELSQVAWVTSSNLNHNSPPSNNNSSSTKPVEGSKDHQHQRQQNVRSKTISVMSLSSIYIFFSSVPHVSLK
ncbi:hypothetical protein AVEN_205449-1 [Araneus ventricosus]|uniref:Uncharacterized protein n=1 Tax=Araneus ventricosus TaxID=182803 RepID=A0A4Y2CBY0_ARAVE|nr:hypothetical protein AVEN_205449-1 [Araneus ventricosus]